MTESPTPAEAQPLGQRFEADNPTRVSFRAYALVYAGLADGFTLEKLLQHEKIDPRDWPAGEDYWNERPMQDLADGARLTFELDACQAIEREKWSRSIPPLDEDYAAWLDFSRNLLECGDPGGMLLRIGLAPGDLGRLTRLWARRGGDDNDLTQLRLSVLSRAAQPVEVPRPLPPRFIDETAHDDVDGTGFFSAISEVAASLPFDKPDPARPHVALRQPPPIGTPLPKRVGTLPSVDETAVVDLDLCVDAPRAAMPFVSPPASEAPSDSPRVSSPPAPAPPAPAPPAPAPRAPAPPAPAPPAHAPPAPAPAPTPQAARSPASPAPVVMPPHGQVPPGRELQPPIDIDATSIVVLDFGEALPFGGEHDAPPLANLLPPVDIGLTGMLPPLDLDDSPPFGSPAAGALTIEQLAAVTVELELGTPPTTVLSHYRITASDHARLRGELDNRTARDTSLRQRFDDAKHAYRTWRLGARR